MLTAVAIGDLHCGSRVGLCTKAGLEHSDYGTPVREKLYELYKAGATKGPWHKPDVLIVNGDSTDGGGQKRGGSEQWTTDLDDQVAEAAELILMWKAKKIIIVRGSNYHAEVKGTGMNLEEGVAREVGAEFYPNTSHLPEKRRPRSGYHWYLTLEDYTFHIAHKVGVSRVFHYRTTPIARELLHMKLNDALRHQVDKYKTRCVLRSHAHYFVECKFPNSQGMILPCWQGLSPYMEQEGPLAISPTIGFVGFIIDGNAMRYTDCTWTLEDAQLPPHRIIR